MVGTIFPKAPKAETPIVLTRQVMSVSAFSISAFLWNSAVALFDKRRQEIQDFRNVEPLIEIIAAGQ
jgi:hypothetical protein